MYKIEFQYWDCKIEDWKKAKHKLYESKKAFETYWQKHQEYVHWANCRHRLVGFEDSKIICVYELPIENYNFVENAPL